MNRYIKKTLIVLSATILLFLAAGIVISYFFQDEVIHVVIESINKQVSSQIKVRSAHFSLFRKFPNAAVEFRQVEMSPASDFDTLDFDPQYRKQLLTAKSVFAELNLFRLLKKDYHITRIEVNEGKINLLTDKKDRHNFIFWKTSGTDGGSSPIELKNVTLHHVDLYYQHANSHTAIALNAEKARFNGRFSSKQYSLGVDLEGTMKSFLVDNQSFVDDKPFDLSGKLDVDDKVFRITKGDFTVSEMQMTVSGGFSIDKQVDLDLHFNGKDLDYASFVSLLPGQYRKQLEDYPGKGIFSFEMGMTGVAGKGKNPHIEAVFGVENGVITHQPTKIKLTELSMSGSFTTGKNNLRTTSVLSVPAFSCNIGGGHLKGDISIQNFHKPLIKIKTSGDVDLGHLSRFIPVKSIEDINGRIKGNLSASVRLKGLSVKRPEDIAQLDINGNMEIENAAFVLKDYRFKFDQLNGRLNLGKDISTDKLTVVLNGNDIRINGRIERLFPYLLKQGKTFYLNAGIESRNLDLNTLFETRNTAATTVNTGKGQGQAAFLLPENITFDISLSADNFHYQNLTAQQMVTRLSYKPRIIAVQSIGFKTMSGEVTGSGTIANDASNNLKLLGETNIRKIDIRQLFQAFGNFSQDVVRAGHLKGSLSGGLTFSVGWDPSMNLKTEDIGVESDLELNGGELVNFEPLENLSRFIALEELQNIRFSTLRTQIFIKDKQITIPRTDITSSAINISASGIHYFDNHYSYQVKILLSELLAAKARKSKKENRENEYVEDNRRTGIYLKVEGKGSDFRIAYDKKSARESVAADIQQEKQNLKGILKEEFGWFKKDTLNQPSKHTDKQGKLRFTFDDDETPQQTDKKKKKQEAREKFIEDW